MRRRSFFGFAAGAAIAGPGMAKEAAAKVAQDLALGRGGGLSGGIGQATGGGYSSAAKQSAPEDMLSIILRANNNLKRLTGMTAAQRAKHKRQMGIGALDPDIAGYRSISLSAKMDWQRERQLDRSIAERVSVWQRIADGLGYEIDENEYLP